MKTKDSRTKTKSVGGVSVSIYQHGKGWRVRIRAKSVEIWGDTYPDYAEAKSMFDAKVVEMQNLLRPPTEKELKERARKAVLFEELERKVLPFGCQLDVAVAAIVQQLEEIGWEGVRRVTHLYGPRLAAMKPCTVKQAIEQYREWLVDFDQVSKAHIQNRGRCFREFEATFGERLIHGVTASEIFTWMLEMKVGESAWNSYLYGIRDLFKYAKGFLKALPQTLDVEPEYIEHKKIERKIGPILSIPQRDAFMAALPDRDTWLGFILVGLQHVRESEAQQLVGENFRWKDGKPYEIGLVKPKKKRGEWVPRDIKIKPILQPILARLLPKEGPLFSNNNVFQRLIAIVRALEIPWEKNLFRRTCCSYAAAGGMELKDVAAISGNSVVTLKKHYLAPASADAAELYNSVTIDAERIASLPKRVKSQLEKIAEDQKARAKAMAAANKDQLEIDIDLTTPTQKAA